MKPKISKFSFMLTQLSALVLLIVATVAFIKLGFLYLGLAGIVCALYVGRIAWYATNDWASWKFGTPNDRTGDWIWPGE